MRKHVDSPFKIYPGSDNFSLLPLWSKIASSFTRVTAIVSGSCCFSNPYPPLSLVLLPLKTWGSTQSTQSSLLHTAARVILLKYVRSYHFTLQNAPKVPIILKVKAKVLRTVYKALCDLHALLLLWPHLLPASPHCPILITLVRTSREHSCFKVSVFAVSSAWNDLLLPMFLPYSLTSFKSLLISHLLNEPIPDFPFQNYTSPAPFALFLHHYPPLYFTPLNVQSICIIYFVGWLPPTWM